MWTRKVEGVQRELFVANLVHAGTSKAQQYVVFYFITLVVFVRAENLHSCDANKFSLPTNFPHVLTDELKQSSQNVETFHLKFICVARLTNVDYNVTNIWSKKEIDGNKNENVNEKLHQS